MKHVCRLVTILFLVVCCGCATLDEPSKTASYHHQMGLSFLLEGNYTRALVELTEAEKISPDDPAILNHLGQAFFFKNRLDLAEQKYLQALRLRPDFSEVRNNLGVTYLEMQRWDDAIAQLSIVVNDIFYQNHDNAGMNLALAHFGKGNNATALALLRPIVSRNPKSSLARVNLGRIYSAEGNGDLAIAEFKRAITLNGDNVKAHYYLGLAYIKDKNPDGALAAFSEVVRIDPDGELGMQAKQYIQLLK